jgi:hypothetical protein
VKVRCGFVSNSSSSSFLVTNKNHPGYIKMLYAYQLDPDNCEFTVEDDEVHDVYDNGTWDFLGKHDIDWTEFLEQTSFNG